MTKVRAHRVEPGGRRRRFGRREHTRAPRPGSTARQAKPLGSRFRRKPAQQPAAQGPQRPGPKSGGKPFRLAALASAAVLTFLALTVVSAGSPLLVAAVALVLYATRKSNGQEGGQ